MVGNSISTYRLEDQTCGKSWNEWVQLWWRWCYYEPFENSPALDNSGQYCSRGQMYNELWFLAGTFGGKAERTCEIPPNRSLFLPIVNDLISFATDPHLKTESDLLAYAKADIDSNRYLSVKLDSVKVPESAYYRIRSTVFTLRVPSGKEESCPVETRAVSDGYWIFLRPLSQGYHLLEIKSEKLEFDKMITESVNNTTVPLFQVEVTYHLTIK